MKFRFSRTGILISLFLSLILFAIYSFQDKIKNFFYLIFSPIQRLIFNFTGRLANFYGLIVEKILLKEENEKLKSEIKKLVGENERLKELKKENEVLRGALKMGMEKEFELEIARFAGKEVSGDFLIIDKGMENGIKEGMVVITPEKSLVGKISKVYSNFSTVQIFTDNNFSFDIKMSEKEVTSLAKGMGNFKAQIQFLPKEKTISVGDKVLTSSLGGKFPAGIFVGEIVKVEKSDIEFYQKAQLKPAFEIEKLDYLFIIRNF